MSSKTDTPSAIEKESLRLTWFWMMFPFHPILQKSAIFQNFQKTRAGKKCFLSKKYLLGS